MDEEDAEDLEDDDSDEILVGPCPPDNGHLLKERFTSEWEFVESETRNVRTECRWHSMDLWRESRQAVLKVCSQYMPPEKACIGGVCEQHYHLKTGVGMLISSQLLLYRLTSVFGLPVIRIEPREMYKQCWVVILKRVDDRDSSRLVLSDYKVRLFVMSG